MLLTWYHSNVSKPLDNLIMWNGLLFLAPNPVGSEVNYGTRFQSSYCGILGTTGQELQLQEKKQQGQRQYWSADCQLDNNYTLS